MITNWQTKKLGEVCNIYQPKTISAKEMDANGIYVVFGANGIIGRYNKYNHEEPQLLITCRGATCGSVNISEPKSWITGNAMVVRPKDTSLDLKYLEYIFRGGLDISKVITGAAQPQITRANLEPVKISYPKFLPEQHRIVKILDEVFEKTVKAKENVEKNLKNSKELFESYLQSVFAKPGKDWEEKKLGEVLQKTETVNPLNSPNKEFFYIDVSSVNKENLSIENATSIKGKDAPSRARKLIRTGDVIFATVRPTLRRIAIIPEEFNEQVCSTGYFVLRAKENLVNKLVFYFIQTKSFNERMEKLQKGASYPAVTDSDVKNQIILFPKSLPEQKSIVKKFDALSAETKKLEVIYKQKLADLEELKKSVLKSAFAGKL
ncbi:restriction endonuclease subunit S [Patescibacteria group bacterium]|nr:restriction endonuclease subunit S [Patescibacteria group bacterium]